MNLRLPIFMALLCGACDVQHGFETEVVLSERPNVACISKALGGFGAVEHRSQPGGGMTTLGGQQILEIDSWAYRLNLRLDVYKTPQGWEYHNGNVGLGSSNDINRLANDMPIIRAANQLLDKMCAIPLAKLAVQEV